MPNQIFVEITDFANFARYACAFREFPLRVYSFEMNGKKVLASRRVLEKSLLFFFTPHPKIGRYISYSEKGGKEYCNIANSTKPISLYAPIIQLDSLPSQKSKSKKLQDKFKPIKVTDLDSLVRLTYNPEFPEEPDLTLFTFPYKNKWVVGYITTIDLENTIYFFNYVILDNEPNKPFLKYLMTEDKPPKFSDTFQHGFMYLPVIKLKKCHKIFGLG